MQNQELDYGDEITERMLVNYRDDEFGYALDTPEKSLNVENSLYIVELMTERALGRIEDFLLDGFSQ